MNTIRIKLFEHTQKITKAYKCFKMCFGEWLYPFLVPILGLFTTKDLLVEKIKFGKLVVFILSLFNFSDKWNMLNALFKCSWHSGICGVNTK